MQLHGVKLGFAVTGSHCTLEQIIPVVQQLVDAGAEVVPLATPSVITSDTRFGSADHWVAELERVTGAKIITTIVEAEPIGPKKLFDVIVVAPCTGNTMAKIANGITDNGVLMAVKAQLRNQRPVVLAISTNDGLSTNARNLGILLNQKHILFVPFGQDNPQEKVNSLVAHMDLTLATVVSALQGQQVQPLLRSYS